MSDAAADANELLLTLRASLMPHEVPREIHLVAEIPRNAAGKVRRAELRKILSP